MVVTGTTCTYTTKIQNFQIFVFCIHHIYASNSTFFNRCPFVCKKINTTHGVQDFKEFMTQPLTWLAFPIQITEYFRVLYKNRILKNIIQKYPYLKKIISTCEVEVASIHTWINSYNQPNKLNKCCKMIKDPPVTPPPKRKRRWGGGGAVIRGQLTEDH